VTGFLGIGNPRSSVWLEIEFFAASESAKGLEAAVGR
jgi:hypothetical protein